MPIPSTFVPAELNATSFDSLDPLFQSLLARPINSSGDLEAWLLDRSELSAAVSEGRARLYIAMTCNTDDAAAQSAYASYIEHVAPRLTPLYFELDKRLVHLAKSFPLGPRYTVLLRNAQADVEIFRPENVPLETQLAQLSQKYDQIAGAMTVFFDGQERTLPQMARYQEVTDRAQREAAWRATAERRLKDVGPINDIYDEMIRLRHQVATNAGFTNYVGFTFKAKHRFDYDPAACFRFHDGVEKAIVPLARALEAERKRLLAVDELRPWDLGVDVKGRAPLRPFEGGADMIAKSATAFARLDSRLSALFNQLGTGHERVASASDVGKVGLDLDSRKGKAPGGYQYMLDRSRKPFIFMNAAGMQRDVETIVHEAGHAFHSMLCNGEPLIEYRESPMEFAEVASMSMELLTMKHWGPQSSPEGGGARVREGRGGGGGGEGHPNSNGFPTFYDNPEDFRRACRQQLKNSVLLLPWIATIDAFQHWIYANPTHTREQRTQQWLALDARFGSSVSWRGLEHFKPHTWQRQLHLFNVPFYYIEYGIAQLGALQLWLQSLEHGDPAAIQNYINALSLGGSKPLPELFKAAGLTFDFGPEIVNRLADRVQAELAKYPE
ncbi:oligoendopeptidase F [Phycisphaerales bacterium]|nr:oligoendopeptidase F [Phycisphaerales bacterium]